MDNSFWILFAFFILLDLYVAVVRTALVNAHAPTIINFEGQKPQEINATLNTLERPRLRASFRIIVALTHFAVAGMVGWAAIQIGSGKLTLLEWLGILIAVIFVLLALEFLFERLILRQPELWAIRFHRGATVIDVLMTPFSWLMMNLQGSAALSSKNEHIVTEEELRTWMETEQPGSGLEKDERRMIYSIFQFGDTLVREIMVPRIDVLALDVNTPLQDAMNALVTSGHSRVPVYENSIDDVIGLLYAKDLLKMSREQENARNLRKLLRPAYFVPESKKVDELLGDMQSQRMHLAVVVDEFGGMAGVVTLEDIVEEIVGEIRDEYDQGEELSIQEINPDEYLFKGKVSLDDVNEILNTDLKAELADSLGGFIFGQLGRLPQQGDTIEVENWKFSVEEIHNQRIAKIRARRLQETTIGLKEENNGKRATPTTD